MASSTSTIPIILGAVQLILTKRMFAKSNAPKMQTNMIIASRTRTNRQQTIAMRIGDQRRPESSARHAQANNKIVGIASASVRTLIGQTMTSGLSRMQPNSTETTMRLSRCPEIKMNAQNKKTALVAQSMSDWV